MNKLTIYITTYKDFKPIVKNPVYKILDARDFRNPNDKLDDRFYSEIFMMSKIKPESEYIGFCMYRKYFEFLDDIPDIDKIFETHDIITLKPLTLRYQIRKHYSLCHNVDDLDIVKSIIYSEYKEYKEDFDAFMNSSIFFPYNMFILKKEYFEKYVKFITGVLKRYVEIVGDDIVGRIENNKDKYLKKFSPNDTIEYQYRIGGYIAERLTNVFIMKHFIHPKMYSMVLTEGKYGYKGI